MARVVTTGFEGGDTLVYSTVSGLIIDTGTVRSGTYSAKSTSTAPAGYGDIPLPGAPFTALYLRVPIFTQAGDAVIVLRDNLAHNVASIELDNPTRTIQIKDSGGAIKASSTSQWAINTWYLVEVSITTSGTPSIVVKVDGDVWVSWAGSLAYTSMYYLRTEGAANVRFDDIGINDTSGASDNGWVGEGHLIAGVPTGAGDQTDLTPLAGTNHSQVDERPPDGDVTYVHSAGDGHYDLYHATNLSASIPNDHIITGLHIVLRARQESGGVDGIQPMFKTGGLEFVGAKHTLTTAYKRQAGPFQTINPDTGLVWTEADIDAIQIGEKLVA